MVSFWQTVILMQGSHGCVCFAEFVSLFFTVNHNVSQLNYLHFGMMFFRGYSESDNQNVPFPLLEESNSKHEHLVQSCYIIDVCLLVLNVMQQEHRKWKARPTN
jgi:hypothetical protein